MKSSESTAAEVQLWGPKELAHYLGVCERTAVKLMKQPDFPGFRIGKLWRIHPDDARSAYRAGGGADGIRKFPDA